MARQSIRLSSHIERHSPRLPRYLVIPNSTVSEWHLEGTIVVDGTLNATPIGRRSLKRWDNERWFIDLPDKLCKAARVDTGDRADLYITIASSELPTELADLLSRSSAARSRWERLTPSRQRQLREHILSAKRSETRKRRAHRALSPGSESE